MNYRDAILIGDRDVKCAGRVLTWQEHGIEFEAGEGHNKRRREEIDLCVWHWTGGEGAPPTMAGTLRRAKLGVEFAIEPAGVIWQFCDPLLVDTADAGIVNSRSVGVEIINYGYRARGRPVPSRGIKRPLYSCTLRGKSRRFAKFTMAQLSAAVALADSLSAGLPIPRRVPTDPDYYCVLSETMAPEELEAFTGHIGHFHISERKSDPGFDVLEALRVCFADQF